MGNACVQLYTLGPKDQLLITKFTDKEVINGPGIKVVGLGKTAKRREARQLTPTDYLRIKNTVTNEIRIEKGPALIFLGPWDKVLHEGNAVTLEAGQYVTYKNKLSGLMQNQRGPCIFFLGPYDEYLQPGKRAKGKGKTDAELAIRDAITLKRDEYVRLVDTVTGEIRVERGEQAVYIDPTEVLMEGGKKKAISVDAEKAVLVKDIKSGKQRLVTKEQLFFPLAYDEILAVRKLIKLAEYETVIVKDRFGQYHFVSGVLAAQVAPLGHDGHGNGHGNGKHHLDHVAADDEVKTDDAFPRGTIVPTETKAAKGGADSRSTDAFIDIRSGGTGSGGSVNGGVSFFLPPYCELVELTWSTGIHKDKKTLKRTIFDSRPWFCNYEFVCRTADNVELTLEVTFFWSLENVPAMIRNTDDAPGDICHHARSEIVQSVSKVNLRTFMDNFNNTVKETVIGSGDPFYAERGVRIHSVEVRSFQCVDQSIDKVLQNIIKETTDRINRLQKIESENEVKLEEMRGKIETEKLKGGLIDVRNEHERKQALMEGEAEAARVHSFIDGLDSLGHDKAIELFHLLRKVEIFTQLSQGGANLYLTPEDANLHIGSIGNGDDTFGTTSTKTKTKSNNK